MSTLADRAAVKAGRVEAEPVNGVDQTVPYMSIDLPDFGEFEPGDEDAEQVPVHIAWNRLMRDVKKITKAGKYDGGRSGSYMFRGADQVINAIGPAMRKHGLIVAPVKVVPTYTSSTSKNGSHCRECTVVVTWVVLGPMGDVLPFQPQSAGEAMDYSDKATTKAQTVAQRVMLLTLAMVPTGDPDPDSSYIERGEAQVRTPASYLAEILDEATSRPRMTQIRKELQQHRIGAALVTNEQGAQEKLGAVLDRIGFERFAPKPAPTVHTDHATDDYDETCAGCLAESAEFDRAAATS